MPHEATNNAFNENELEIANQLANEASLGFGDLFSMLHSKSKKSQHAERTLMSAMNTESPPLRSRSQSYRDRQPPAEVHAHPSRSSLEEPKRKNRNENIVVTHNNNETMSNRRDSSHRSDNSHKKALNLVVKQKQTSHG